jgi:pantoate--beta-alanine ligase
MKVVKTVKELSDFRKSAFFKEKQVGFVPTMGALHKGHSSLIEKSVADNDYTIVSIFVNPRQFNDKNDYVNYPVNNADDIELLKSVKCDLLFLPSPEDIYKDYDGFHMDFNGLDEIHEGKFRPGHFQGVVDVVYRLFDIVKPDKAYFGEKDFQQLAIIKLMVKIAKLPIDIIPCPIVREASGLAMSSRNERLSKEERKKASEIYRIISNIEKTISVNDKPEDLINKISCEIDKIEFLNTEYVIFCNHLDLIPVGSFEKNSIIMLCVAVWCEKVRLIDNIRLQF